MVFSCLISFSLSVPLVLAGLTSITSPPFTSLVFSFDLSPFLLPPSSVSCLSSVASPAAALAGPVGEKPAQINAWSGLALKIHLKALCKFLGAGGGGAGVDMLSGVSEEGSNRLCVCEPGYAEEGESNHAGLCCCLTLRFPWRLTFQAVWPS